MGLTTLIIFLMGFADLYRGAKAGLTRAIEKSLLGALAGFALMGTTFFDQSWQFLVSYLIAFSVGCSISWGAVINGSLKKDSSESFQAHVDRKQDKGDWYLVGWFRTSPMRGLFARAMLWGVLPAVPLWYFIDWQHGLSMFLTYTISMLAAVKFLHLVEGSKFDQSIGRMCLKLVDKDRAWARHEVYRGWIAGAILATIGYFI